MPILISAEAMASNAMCGFSKLSKANMEEALALMGLKYDGDGKKAEMAQGLYENMKVMGQENKQFKKRIAYLEKKIDELEDY